MKALYEVDWEEKGNPGEEGRADDRNGDKVLNYSAGLG